MPRQACFPSRSAHGRYAALVVAGGRLARSRAATGRRLRAVRADRSFAAAPAGPSFLDASAVALATAIPALTER